MMHTYTGVNDRKSVKTMNKQIINKQEILYKRRVGPYGPENKILMEDFKKIVKGLNVMTEDSAILAIAHDNPTTTNPIECRYDVCLTNFKQRHNYKDLQIGSIDEGLYYIFVIDHTEEALQLAWSTLFETLHNENVTIDMSRPIIERYAEKLLKDNLCELCVPIIE